MTDPVLPKSYKRAFPFPICTTSYIYPAAILPNVQRLAPFFDEIELLWFESRHLPNAEEIRAIARVAAETELTLNLHLPLDIALGDAQRLRRSRSVETIKTVFERAEPLSLSSACLHLNLDPSLGDPGAHRRWTDRCFESLEAIQQWRGNLTGIVVENLWYPFEWIQNLIETFDLSVCLDIGHLFRYGFDAERIHAKFKDRIAIMHLHGVHGEKDHLGLDRMDPRYLKRALGLIDGFTGVVSVEVFAFQPLAASMAVLERWPFTP